MGFSGSFSKFGVIAASPQKNNKAVKKTRVVY
jgi:hypothetical protein